MGDHLRKRRHDTTHGAMCPELFNVRTTIPVIHRSQLAIAAELAERARPANKVFVLYKLETRAQRAAKKALEQSNQSKDDSKH